MGIIAHSGRDVPSFQIKSFTNQSVKKKVITVTIINFIFIKYKNKKYLKGIFIKEKSYLEYKKEEQTKPNQG